MHNWTTRGSEALLWLAGKLMPARDVHWLQAMRTELQHIESGAEKLLFAWGCITTSFRSAFANGGAEGAIRIMIIPALLIWAAGKIYLWLAIPEPRLIPLAEELFVIAAAGYAWAAIMLLRRKPLMALAALSVPLIANVVHFGMVARYNYVGPAIEGTALLALAIIGEEFVIWIGAMLGLVAMLVLPKARSGSQT